ncbi:MAG: hypothetical protein KDC12_05200 [Flavobacteriales bacterium]|nr:hypothetical protein [Flavobacteriales bacterium]
MKQVFQFVLLLGILALPHSIYSASNEPADATRPVLENTDPRCKQLDLNGNDRVDTPDLLIFLGEYGSRYQLGWLRADFNSNGLVDLYDLMFLLPYMNQSCN